MYVHHWIVTHVYLIRYCRVHKSFSLCFRIELCAFSGYKIYPGHGSRFIKVDGKVSGYSWHRCHSLSGYKWHSVYALLNKLQLKKSNGYLWYIDSVKWCIKINRRVTFLATSSSTLPAVQSLVVVESIYIYRVVLRVIAELNPIDGYFIHSWATQWQ